MTDITNIDLSSDSDEDVFRSQDSSAAPARHVAFALNPIPRHNIDSENETDNERGSGVIIGDNRDSSSEYLDSPHIRTPGRRAIVRAPRRHHLVHTPNRRTSNQQRIQHVTRPTMRIPAGVPNDDDDPEFEDVEDAPDQTPSQHGTSRTHQNNRAQTHTPSRLVTSNFRAHDFRPPSARRVGTKRKDGSRSDDVGKFVRRDEDTRTSFCAFCEYVLTLFIPSEGKLIKAHRAIHGADSQHAVQKYSFATSIDNIRKHFLRKHADAWFSACQHFKIKVRGRYGSDFNEWLQHQNLPAEDLSQQQEERIAFSMGAFIDALVDFIVADDQARI